MGDLAAALEFSEPGCSIYQKMLEIDAHESLDDEDKAAFRKAVEDPTFPPAAVERSLRTIGLTINKESIQNHRAHGDCTKTKRLPNRGTHPTAAKAASASKAAASKAKSKGDK